VRKTHGISRKLLPAEAFPLHGKLFPLDGRKNYLSYADCESASSCLSADLSPQTNSNWRVPAAIALGGTLPAVPHDRVRVPAIREHRFFSCNRFRNGDGAAIVQQNED
jgi:hypothetical protein